jgi:hypothetical protein
LLQRKHLYFLRNNVCFSSGSGHRSTREPSPLSANKRHPLEMKEAAKLRRPNFPFHSGFFSKTRRSDQSGWLAYSS